MNKMHPKPAEKKSEPRVPTDLRKALAAAPSVEEAWDGLTPIARRDFVSWINSAKQPETRRRRIESLGSRLASGKRRPCCYAVVPMNLYKALGVNQKAKAHWKNLTPDERRDFVDWIDSGNASETQKQRIEKACALLAAGKRPPKR